MERLTHERMNGIKEGYWSPAKKQDLVDRLAEYENTGLEPEEVLALKDLCDAAIEVIREMQQYLEIGASPERLKELIFEGSAAKRILHHYQEIGTIEECRAAMEKVTEKIKDY